MKKLLFFIVLSFGLFSAPTAQDFGTISPDTLDPQHSVVVPPTLNGIFFERTYEGDSVVKKNDRYTLKFNVNRQGGTDFDSIKFVYKPKTNMIDTLNNHRGYIWRIRFELLPR